MAIDKEIEKAFSETFPSIEKPTCPKKYGWNDTECERLSNQYKFPRECLEASTQRAVLIRYVNFYSAGEVAEGLTPFDIIAAMIAIFPPESCSSASQTIWPDHFFDVKDLICDIAPEYSIGEESAQGSSSKVHSLDLVSEPGPLAKLDTETGVTVSELPGSSSGNQTTETTNPILYNYTSAISKSFLETIRKSLLATDATAAQGKATYTIRRVLGYTALTLVRSLVKEPLQMANAFSKAQYRKNLVALLSLSDVIYCPPCSKALSGASDAFNKQLSKPVFLFSMIVQRWKLLSTGQDKKMAAMLGASCLTHTSYNGMALIHLLIEVIHHFNVDWSELCILLYMDITRESWRRIAQFMQVYQNKSGPLYTQPWARVIDDGYLKEYSGQDNFALCTILAASIDDSVDGIGGVWDSQWAKTRQAEIQDLKKLGYALRSYYSKKLTEIKGLTEESKKLLSHATTIASRPTAPVATTIDVSLFRDDV
jgi:hypothetical protein